MLPQCAFISCLTFSSLTLLHIRHLYHLYKYILQLQITSAALRDTKVRIPSTKGSTFPHPLRPQTGRPRMGKAISLHCLLLSFTGTLHPFQGPWHYLGTGAHPTTPASLLKKAPLVTNCEQTPWRPSLAATHSSLLAGYAAPGMPQLGIATLRLVIPLSHVPI